MKKLTKAHLICYVLKVHGPMPRVEILRRVYVLQPGKVAFKPTSNVSYFLKRASPCAYGHGKQSVVVKGLVKGFKVGKETHYKLTEKGEALVEEYITWREGANQE